MKLIWTWRAERDLRDQIDYIARDSVKPAIDVEDRVLEALAGLVDHPAKGRTCGVKATRELPVQRTSLLVIYTLTDDDIEILHIRHMARRPFGAGEEFGED